MWQSWGSRSFPDSAIPVAWLRKWAPALAAVLLISLGGNVWQCWQASGLRQPGEPRVMDAESGAMNHNKLFNTYEFQSGIRSATNFGTFVVALYSHGDSHLSYEDLFDPYAMRTTCFRIGTRYAEALALLHSGDLAGTAQRLEAITKAFHEVQVPSVLSQYLTAMQTLLQPGQVTPEALEKFLALFKPLYVAEYARDNATEELVLFRAGTWLANMSLAAWAGDKTSLRQGARRGISAARDGPVGCSKGGADGSRADATPRCAAADGKDGDVKEVLKLVQKIQQIFGRASGELPCGCKVCTVSLGVPRDYYCWCSGSQAQWVIPKNTFSTGNKICGELRTSDDPRAAEAHKSFARLLHATGHRPIVPRLFITKSAPWDISFPVALSDGWVLLSKKVLDFCYRVPAWGDDRLAFVLAHEIVHLLQDDFWHMQFFQALEGSKTRASQQSVSLQEVIERLPKTEDIWAKELRADERGIVYAAMAGFNTPAIVTEDDHVNFFQDWVHTLDPRRLNRIPANSPYPTPQQQAEAVKARLRQVLDHGVGMFHT